MTASIWIPGEPQPKERPRARVMGKSARIYTPAKTRKAEERIALLWGDLPCVPKGEPVAVTLNAYHQRPQAHRLTSGSLSKSGLASLLPTKRPDLDNIIKLVLDGLNGKAYEDDSQIVSLFADRKWCALGEEAGVQVIVQRLRPTATS